MTVKVRTWFGLVTFKTWSENYLFFKKDDAEEISPEERQVRLKKADSIRKMLAEQSTHSSMNSGTKTFC